MDDDDDFMPDFDPFDLLQEHNLMLNRLVKAVNAQEKTITALARQNRELSTLLIKTNARIELLEKRDSE